MRQNLEKNVSILEAIHFLPNLFDAIQAVLYKTMKSVNSSIAVSDFEDFFEIGEVVFATCHPGTFFGTTCLCFFHVCSWKPPCYINHTMVESMTVTATKWNWEIDIQRHLPT